MSYAKPKFRHPRLPKNALGYTVADYDGAISTLCAGCGHDSISGAIRNACFLSSIPPHRIAKMSGIGCSSSQKPAEHNRPRRSTDCGQSGPTGVSCRLVERERAARVGEPQGRPA